MKIWKEEHGKEVEQGVPITSRVLARWLRALPHTTADPTLLTAILRVGHAGLLRAGELCRRERQSDPGSHQAPGLLTLFSRGGPV